MTKRPIDIFRGSAGSFSIANPEDGTAIKEMFTYSDFLLILTEKCAYKIQTADQIDPKRLNASLPKVIQQKLFDYGTESEIVGRTLLTAKGMFRKEFLPDSVDLERCGVPHWSARLLDPPWGACARARTESLCQRHSVVSKSPGSSGSGSEARVSTLSC
jgi:hypothetical protein